MTEERFFEMRDILDEADNVTEGYFPTVEELEEEGVASNPEKYAPILIYFALDPLSKFNLKESEDAEYKRTVDYCCDIVSKIEFISSAEEPAS